MKTTSTVLACIVALTLGSFAFAQQEQQQRQQRTGDSDRSQRAVAMWLLLGNNAEIELANLALEKTENAQVRQFAEKMIKDHTAFADKLQGVAPAGRRAGEARTGGGGAAAEGRGGSGRVSMHTLSEQACKIELEMTKELLSHYKGQDFDMGYLGQQIVAHTKMLAKLKTAKEHSNGELQQLVDEGITTTQKHLEEAKSIAKKLESKEDSI